MLRVISLVIGLCFFSTLSVSSSPALAWGDTLLKCKIKGVGVRNFKLEDGIRDAGLSRGLGDVYKRQFQHIISLIFTCSRLGRRLNKMQN